MPLGINKEDKEEDLEKEEDFLLWEEDHLGGEVFLLQDSKGC